MKWFLGWFAGSTLILTVIAALALVIVSGMPTATVRFSEGPHLGAEEREPMHLRVSPAADGNLICSLEGCCSSHGSVGAIDLASGLVLCTDGSESKQCSCAGLVSDDVFSLVSS